jgi:hypothetical protein
VDHVVVHQDTPGDRESNQFRVSWIRLLQTRVQESVRDRVGVQIRDSPN